MPPVRRQFFTVDLRGLRAALGARAAEQGLSESDVLRSALATVLVKDDTVLEPLPSSDERAPPPTHIKLSVRLPRRAAFHLDRNARAAGLSRGAYLTRLIDGAPPVIASTERAAGIAALNASSAELALLSRDISHLTLLLRSSAVEAARPYRERLDNLDADVRVHLDLAAAVLAELVLARTSAGRPSNMTPHRRSQA